MPTTTETFYSELTDVAHLQSGGVKTVSDIAQEIGMFSCTPEFVRRHGGPIALEFLSLIPESWVEESISLGLYPNIDVRVHRLYPSDYPAVPGWHCDGEYRKDWHAQPYINHVPPHSHLIGTVSTDESGVSLTEVFTSPLTIEIKESVKFWDTVHKAAEMSDGKTVMLSDGVLRSLGSRTLHRATPARVRGWRLMFRASMWHKPVFSKEGGNIARQETVYRLHESTGW